MLRRAVDCFLRQHHERRELIVLHEDTDTETRDFLAQLASPHIRSTVVPATPHLRLGTKRNLLVRAARGTYVANWDDDDWSSPERLAQQLRVVQESRLPACVIQFEVIFDELEQRAYLSAGNTWENSIFCERAVMPPYADLDVAEDVPVVKQLIAARQLVSLASPHLYVYVYHGRNTGPAVHFDNNVFGHATHLTPACSQRVAGVLASPDAAPLTLEEILSGRVRRDAAA